jgi:hypothetical protein
MPDHKPRLCPKCEGPLTARLVCTKCEAKTWELPYMDFEFLEKNAVKL